MCPQSHSLLPSRTKKVSYFSFPISPRVSSGHTHHSLDCSSQVYLVCAVNLCPAPDLSLTNGSAPDVFRVIDLIFTATLSLSLSCSSSSNTWHALQNHAAKSFFHLLVATQYKTLVVPVTVSVVDTHENCSDWLWCQLAALPK